MRLARARSQNEYTRRPLKRLIVRWAGHRFKSCGGILLSVSFSGYHAIALTIYITLTANLYLGCRNAAPFDEDLRQTGEAGRDDGPG
jgi:hypothetical protein